MGDATWLKVISSQSNDPHLSRLSGNLKQMQTIIINIIQYLQLICQGFTETFDSKLNSEADDIRHKQKKKQIASMLRHYKCYHWERIFQF